MKIILGAHFDTDEADEIKAVAEGDDITVAQLIRRAVREYMKRYRPLEKTLDQSNVREQVAA